MDVIVFAVHLNKLGLEVEADLGEDGTESFDSISVKSPSSANHGAVSPCCLRSPCLQVGEWSRKWFAIRDLEGLKRICSFPAKRSELFLDLVSLKFRCHLGLRSARLVLSW